MKKIFFKLAYFVLLCIIVVVVGYFSMGTFNVTQWTKEAHETATTVLIIGGFLIFLYAGDND